MGSTRRNGKAVAAANAKASAKVIARPRKEKQSRPQKQPETLGRWTLIASSEATAARLAAEPNTTVVLSEQESEWRRSIERSAQDDPRAYLESLSD